MNEPTLARRRELTILTKLSESFSNANLNLRHTLVDTLEERGIGEVVYEGMGEDFMEVTLEIDSWRAKEDEIRSILKSLGILETSELRYRELEDE